MNSSNQFWSVYSKKSNVLDLSFSLRLSIASPSAGSLSPLEFSESSCPINLRSFYLLLRRLMFLFRRNPLFKPINPHFTVNLSNFIITCSTSKTWSNWTLNKICLRILKYNLLWVQIFCYLYNEYSFNHFMVTQLHQHVLHK